MLDDMIAMLTQFYHVQVTSRYDILPIEKKRFRGCTAPIFINWQGLVSPCRHLPDSTWGNIFEERLEGIVKRIQQSRRRFAHYCNECEHV